MDALSPQVVNSHLACNFPGRCTRSAGLEASFKLSGSILTPRNLGGPAGQAKPASGPGDSVTQSPGRGGRCPAAALHRLLPQHLLRRVVQTHHPASRKMHVLKELYFSEIVSKAVFHARTDFKNVNEKIA